MKEMHIHSRLASEIFDNQMELFQQGDLCTIVLFPITLKDPIQVCRHRTLMHSVS